MDGSKERVPAVEGWFTMDAENPELIGSHCSTCNTYYFPKETNFCRNPDCSSSELLEVKLSTEGVLWSFTNNCYAPPEPYIKADPFVPYAIAAVELKKEKMVVLGQIVEGVQVEDLKAGMSMKLKLDRLYEKENQEFMVWKWEPIQEGESA